MDHGFHLLLIEDSPADARLVARALAEVMHSDRLTVLPDGRKAMEYLGRLRDPACPAPLRPDLVLLDLNLPGLDGFQVLEAIKADPTLRHLPVVILTTSRREEDVLRSYLAGANTYFQKPDEFGHFADLIRTLRSYWHGAALRPPRRLPAV